MNEVRERILTGMSPYMDFSEHRDLISFCVDSECFEDWDDTENDVCADFSELVVIVEKEWLFADMRKDGIENPLEYLKHEYISDNSYDWFVAAKATGKVVLVGFN